MRDRYLRDDRSIRLGNLSSNLLRLSEWVRMGQQDETIIDLLREIAWMIEWSGDLALAELVDIQREVCRWRRIWPNEQARYILSLRASERSNKVLKLSGIIKYPAFETKLMVVLPGYIFHSKIRGRTKQ